MIYQSFTIYQLLPVVRTWRGGEGLLYVNGRGRTHPCSWSWLALYRHSLIKQSVTKFSHIKSRFILSDYITNFTVKTLHVIFTYLSQFFFVVPGSCCMFVCVSVCMCLRSFLPIWIDLTSPEIYPCNPVRTAAGRTVGQLDQLDRTVVAGRNRCLLVHTAAAAVAAGSHSWRGCQRELPEPAPALPDYRPPLSGR